MEFIRDEKRDRKIHFIIITLTILMLFFGMCSQPATAQICTIKDLQSLLSRSETDSVLKIERLAAVKFHKLINEYRVSKGVKPLRWNDTLWLAARNHNIYMWSVNLLWHNEDKKDKCFTGVEIDDRVAYVAKTNLHYMGENCLFNYDTKGKNIKIIAEKIAKESFKIWKESVGHNENMLLREYEFHGTAFNIIKSKEYGIMVWGTDDFCKSTPFFANK